MENVLVSVFMLTYNQEKYITQAIEGVLMQKTSFPFQLVIGDDCSSDQTTTICEAFAKKYPEKIKLSLNSGNIGIGANYVKTYSQCTGKYVAICDGDDYWVDPYKLQKQINILEGQSTIKIVFTKKIDLYPSGEKRDSPNFNSTTATSSFKDLIFGNYIPSVTVVFKNTPLSKSMEEWISELPYGDWPTYLLVLHNGGEIYFLEETTAIYRKGSGTSTVLRKKKSRPGELNLKILKSLMKEEAFKNKRDLIILAIYRQEIGLMGSYNKEKRFIRSLKLLIKLLGTSERKPVVKAYLYSLKRSFLP